MSIFGKDTIKSMLAWFFDSQCTSVYFCPGIGGCVKIAVKHLDLL